VSKKLPHIQLYTGDWMKDPKLSMCAPATRGVWIDLLCAMHEQDRVGELRGTTEQIARLARCTPVELVAALTDLQTNRAAEVERRNGVYIIINRRMVRDAEERALKAASGSKGGSKTASTRQARPDTDSDSECQNQIEAYCVEIGLPASDGASCFAKWQANGWTNGGQPIRDWKATIRSWKLQGYLPSQKPTGRNGTPPSKRSETRLTEKELAELPVFEA